MKVKVLEEKNKEKYLIERYYKTLNHKEYIVCENYDFKTNTYTDGLILFNLPLAYLTFNTFVNSGVLLKESNANGQVEVID